MIVRIQVRRGTSTQWTNSNPVLHSGEFGYETNTGKLKIGNGTDVWNTLSYLQGSGGGGADGLSAYQIAVNHGFVGTEQEWLISLQGADGVDGENGESAYEIALNNGFAGTEQDWLESLSPVRYMDGDIFEGDGETPETKTTIKDGSIEEGKLSEEVKQKLNNQDGDSESVTSKTLFIPWSGGYNQGGLTESLNGGSAQTRNAETGYIVASMLESGNNTNGAIVKYLKGQDSVPSFSSARGSINLVALKKSTIEQSFTIPVLSNETNSFIFQFGFGRPGTVNSTFSYGIFFQIEGSTIKFIVRHNNIDYNSNLTYSISAATKYILRLEVNNETGLVNFYINDAVEYIFNLSEPSGFSLFNQLLPMFRLLKLTGTTNTILYWGMGHFKAELL